MQAQNGQLWLSPSDVTSFLACAHATVLKHRVARGELDVPEAENAEAELIFRKGLEHEEAYLARLKSEGKSVAEISDGDWESRREATIDAMCAGVDTVYQAAFLDA